MILDRMRKIYVNTGNLINCKEFNRRATQSPTEEVLESVNCTLQSFLKTDESTDDGECLYCVNSKNAIKVSKTDRINLKLTVKVFLQSFSCDHLKEAINEAMQQLGVDFMDSVILALPNSSPSSLSLENVQPLWLVLEQLASEGKVVTIGISDLDTGQLLDLYHWAQVKPSVNQVNLESCCVMPPEMTAFAKENDIQLLTHNDPKDLLPQSTLQSLLQPFTQHPAAWDATWLLRYSVVVKCRGIIQSKGYLLSAIKEQHPVSNGPC